MNQRGRCEQGVYDGERIGDLETAPEVGNARVDEGPVALDIPLPLPRPDQRPAGGLEPAERVEVARLERETAALAELARNRRADV